MMSGSRKRTSSSLLQTIHDNDDDHNYDFQRDSRKYVYEVGSSSSKKKPHETSQAQTSQTPFVNQSEISQTPFVNQSEQTTMNKQKREQERQKAKHLARTRGKQYMHASRRTAELIRLSDFTEQCVNCSALHFQEEQKSGHKQKNEFHDCCGSGKLTVLFDNILPYPQNMRDLFAPSNNYHKAFMTNIRKINNSFALASLSCFKFQFHTPGPPVFKVQGQVYHKFNTVAIPEMPEQETNGQLYFIEPFEATAKRKSTTNSPIALLTLIEQEMRANNRLAESYKFMKEIIEEQEKIAIQMGTTKPEVKLLFSVKDKLDPTGRPYNMPKVNEVYAIVVCDQDGQIPPARIVVQEKGAKTLINLPSMDTNIEPMTYPILYPLGNKGWDYEQKDRTGKKISLCDYVKFRLFIRPDTLEHFLPHHHSGKLFQQWLVGSYARIEWDRLMFIRNNQTKLARTDASRIHAYLDKRNTASDHEPLQKTVIILPSSFSNSPRFMEENFINAMCIMNRTGKPDLFLTFTCNPMDEDIVNSLLPGQQATDRPDLVARVFNLKMQQILKLIYVGELFGKALSHVWTIEYQLRGLPHMHLLVTLDKDFKWHTRQEVDKFVSAEIPDPDKEPELYALVTKFMIHGPCHPGSACWDHKKRRCGKKFPKPYMDETRITEDGYPLYMRRNNGRHVYRKNIPLDNRYVVPYNAYLLLATRSHINVEKIADVKAIKYIYKYVYKGGFDKTVVECVTTDPITGEQRILKYDEVSNYLEARCISPCEAAWRIFKFPNHGKSHSVMPMAVHLEGQQPLYVNNDEVTVEELEDKVTKTSQLEAYFDYMRENPDKHYKFAEMPEHCTWKPREQKWTDRKGNFNSFGRLYPVSIYDTERFYLYFLLLNVPARSFAELKCVGEKQFNTYAEAAMERGLCQNDDEWFYAMQEASHFQYPYALRQLFSNILIHCGPKCPERLWDSFKDDMSEDFVFMYKEKNYSAEICYQFALDHINNLLLSQDKSLEHFAQLPQLSGVLKKLAEKLEDDEVIDRLAELRIADEMSANLNQAQLQIYKRIRAKLIAREQICIFIDGPGGCGKSYLLTCIYHLVRSMGLKIVNLAFSGIAANNLKQGRTLHHRFKLPLDIHSESTSGIVVPSVAANELLTYDMFVWDEAPTASKYMMEIIDRKLREITNNVNTPFGGKSFVLSGDFRQIPPIVKHSVETEISDATIKRSPLWQCFEQHQLHENMRANPMEQSFARELLAIGDGTLMTDTTGFVQIPQQCLISSREELIEEIFGTVIREKQYSQLHKCAILSPLNTIVDLYNEKIMDLFPGEFHTYPSHDDYDQNTKLPVSVELLNNSNCKGMPDHILSIKMYSIVMLLRNLNVREGLCNGTRLMVNACGKNIITCSFITGDRKGKQVFIPRITLIENKAFPYVLRRHQFPLKIAFAFTINKSQSQTFEKIGIDFTEPVFNHGQTYVALSRARSWNGIKVLLRTKQNDEDDVVADDANEENMPPNNLVKNIVIRKLLL